MDFLKLYILSLTTLLVSCANVSYHLVSVASVEQQALFNPAQTYSYYDEIVSGEGIHLMEQNPNMSEQELAQQMFDQFGDSTLGQEQTQAAGIPPEAYPPHINEAVKKAVGDGTLKNPDNPEALKKALKEILNKKYVLIIYFEHL